MFEDDRSDQIRNTDICRKLNCGKDIVEKIQQRRLHCFGHVIRMSNNRYSKIALDGYVRGQRIRGRSEKRWLEVVVEDCQEKGLNIQDATRLVDEKDGVLE